MDGGQNAGLRFSISAGNSHDSQTGQVIACKLQCILELESSKMYSNGYAIKNQVYYRMTFLSLLDR